MISGFPAPLVFSHVKIDAHSWLYDDLIVQCQCSRGVVAVVILVVALMCQCCKISSIAQQNVPASESISM